MRLISNVCSKLYGRNSNESQNVQNMVRLGRGCNMKFIALAKFHVLQQIGDIKWVKRCNAEDKKQEAFPDVSNFNLMEPFLPIDLAVIVNDYLHEVPNSAEVVLMPFYEHTDYFRRCIEECDKAYDREAKSMTAANIENSSDPEAWYEYPEHYRRAILESGVTGSM